MDKGYILMIGKIRDDVSGTAFIVNYSRSKRVDISKDIYAHLWVTPESIALWSDLAKNVYPNDDLNVSLRNRFFLETAEKFIAANRDAVFASIAAGFDNYPFLLPAGCRSMEFDLPNIMEFKKEAVARLTEEGNLPGRNIEFIPVDLNKKEQRAVLKKMLTEKIKRNPSFIMMEGLTYYLKQEALSDIFSILKDVQAKGSIVAFDYWKPDAMSLKGIEDYAEIESTDIAKLELVYSDTRVLQDKDNRIPENYSVILKNDRDGGDHGKRSSIYNRTPV